MTITENIVHPKHHTQRWPPASLDHLPPLFVARTFFFTACPSGVIESVAIILNRSDQDTFPAPQTSQGVRDLTRHPGTGTTFKKCNPTDCHLPLLNAPSFTTDVFVICIFESFNHTTLHEVIFAGKFSIGRSRHQNEPSFLFFSAQEPFQIS